MQLEGDEYPLNEVAQVSRKSPQVVLINAAAFPQALPGIMTAIRAAGMNLNPQQEGTTIIVPIPKWLHTHVFYAVADIVVFWLLLLLFDVLPWCIDR